jgi:hypothetical protein
MCALGLNVTGTFKHANMIIVAFYPVHRYSDRQLTQTNRHEGVAMSVYARLRAFSLLLGSAGQRTRFHLLG